MFKRLSTPLISLFTLSACASYEVVEPESHVNAGGIYVADTIVERCPELLERNHQTDQRNFEIMQDEDVMLGIYGEIDPNNLSFRETLQYFLDHPGNPEGKRVFIELNSPGGRVDATKQMIQAMEDFGTDHITVFANELAYSGGLDILIAAGTSYAHENVFFLQHEESYQYSLFGAQFRSSWLSEEERMEVQNNTEIRVRSFQNKTGLSASCASAFFTNDDIMFDSYDALALGIIEGIVLHNGEVLVLENPQNLENNTLFWT